MDIDPDDVASPSLPVATTRGAVETADEAPGSTDLSKQTLLQPAKERGYWEVARVGGWYYDGGHYADDGYHYERRFKDGVASKLTTLSKSVSQPPPSSTTAAAGSGDAGPASALSVPAKRTFARAFVLEGEGESVSMAIPGLSKDAGE